ncbi:MAG: PhzF family phenazine biosynthesis protein [Thermoplasmata archaeon]
MRIRQVDSFTSVPFSGNPAAVVLNADELSEEQMQLIAREINLSETCFISSGRGGHHFNFRWFTPATEVDACGHATLAGLHTLAEEGLVPLSEEPTVISVGTKSGVWSARLWVEGGSTIIMFSMLQGPILLEPCPLSPEDLAKALRVDEDEIRIGENRPEILKANYRQLIVPVRSMKTLERMMPDFGTLSSLLRKLDTSMHVFTLEVLDESSDAHSRHFAPNYGIDEDPVTGAGNAALFAYLAAKGLVEVTGSLMRLVSEQGHIIGRPGHVKGEVHMRDGEVERVEIGGSAVTIMDADLKLPM